MGAIEISVCVCERGKRRVLSLLPVGGREGEKERGRRGKERKKGERDLTL